ncbi:O-acetyl-ADP-ribose deacetylase macrod2, variant 2 [Entomophthora muscae]|uniref:O-acetyl-ADP-ribose deacetylase macrod2, variant 2 n=2 Tax=Entomophthora muscae TaxID=34485 RepID=A0ACC2RGX6_9FUNG|nr:O-acetyl-ADP-ribose deacetylase macrod2, variant 2 [Entomophthora muscae]
MQLFPRERKHWSCYVDNMPRAVSRTKILSLPDLETWAEGCLSHRLSRERVQAASVSYPDEEQQSTRHGTRRGNRNVLNSSDNDYDYNEEEEDYELSIEDEEIDEHAYFLERLGRGSGAFFRESYDFMVNLHPSPSSQKLPAYVHYEPSYELNSRISLWQGDITRLALDAIVNATSPDILHGAGVTRAIVAAGGPGLVAECRMVVACRPGKVRLTGGHSLPSKYVLHTVGPSGEAPSILRSCYRNCLDLAAAHNPPLRTIAFPCIATGVRRYPNPAAAHVALSAVSSWLRSHPDSSIQRVVFCTFLDMDYNIYNQLLPTYFPAALPQFPTFSLQ